MPDFPLVSVIVPTYRSSATLEDCLVSIRKQDYPAIELIVVDNHSADATVEIAKKYADATHIAWPERTAQKNYGLKQSKGTYVCFVDSDMVLSPGILSEAVSKLEGKPSAGGICFPEKSVGEGLFVRIRDFERSFYRGTSVESARFFRKSDVVSVGGFEEGLIFFEESLLPQKIEHFLGLDCRASVASFVFHQEGKMALRQWLKKKYYYGKSLGEYRKKVGEIGIPETGKWQVGIVWRYAIFLKEKRFYERPLLALGVLGLKTLEFWAGGLGYASRIICK